MSVAEALGPSAAQTPTLSRSGSELGKRLFDLVLGVPLCLIGVPLVAALAVVLAVQSRTNPFFVHDRVGRHGRIIAMPKLRTLSRCTHPYADKTVVPLESVSRLALALRSLHFDELPQLLMVPLGRMSLVGPRPRMGDEVEQCGDVDYEVARTSVPQGCTGLWQISQDGSGRVSDHPEYDRFYIEQHTRRLDLWILWRTAIQMLGAAPISLADIPRWLLRHPDRALAAAA